MLDSLINKFPITAHLDVSSGSDDLPEPLQSLLGQVGGSTLTDGFYRFHTTESVKAGNVACAQLINGFQGRFHVFAFDWLGRHLAFDTRPGTIDGKVIAVDPGGGEYLTTDCPLSEWHDAVAGPEDPLAYPFYLEWREANPSAGPLRFDQVIGYKVPLFLGGADEVSNLEIIDFAVYFELCTQLAHGVTTMPPGTTIHQIGIE
jgi:hypothetical protein